MSFCLITLNSIVFSFLLQEELRKRSPNACCLHRIFEGAVQSAHLCIQLQLPLYLFSVCANCERYADPILDLDKYLDG